ncbi:hypothetical protein JZ785_13805 [Alicyclobacillus curvatus]|nr:hypothetical protein JZ785_13805 [Alicyclobacillus curvatus]
MRSCSGRVTPRATKCALLEAIGDGAKAGSVRDAINFGEAVLLAIPGTEMERALEGVDFQNKVVMNSVNLADGRSAGMEVIRLATNARVVRVFNTVPSEVIARP